MPALVRGLDGIVFGVGHLATIALLCLTGGIIIGIVMRWVGIDNSWTYDFDLFSLLWVAFTGAVVTARHNRHVTSGIALERMFENRGIRLFLKVLRAVIVIGFLVLFTVSAWREFANSWQTAETTIDAVRWPVWVAKAALPVGGAFWALAEFVKVLRGRFEDPAS